MHLIEQWEEWLEAKANVPIIQNNSDISLLVSIYIESDASLTLQICNPARNIVTSNKLRTFFTILPNSDIRIGPPKNRSKIRVAVFA